MFGSHLSITGGMTRALDEAESLGLDCLQVFTKNQQQWKAPPLSETAIESWNKRISELGWNRPPAHRAVSHASYLINLASPDDELWARSIDLMQEEIERCERLGIRLLVHHPGSHRGSGVGAGIARIADAYQELFRRTPGYQTVMCLENTVGAGATLGGPFDELAELRSRICERTGEGGRVGFCFDTCHAHAAGHDMASGASASRSLDAFEQICGRDHLLVLHLNDSKAACGSRLDRHEHVGLGTIGLEGFMAVLSRIPLRVRPMILETPKGAAPSGAAHDRINLDILESLLCGDISAASKILSQHVTPAPKAKGSKSSSVSQTPDRVRNIAAATPSKKRASKGR